MRAKIILFLFLFFFIVYVILCLEKRSGFIGIGPESIYFYDCFSNEKLWIVNSLDEVEGWKGASLVINEQPICDRTSIPCRHQTVMVDAYVFNVNFGDKGHLGKYDGEVYVVKVSNPAEFDEGLCATK